MIILNILDCTFSTINLRTNGNRNAFLFNFANTHDMCYTIKNIFFCKEWEFCSLTFIELFVMELVILVLHILKTYFHQSKEVASP